VDDGPIEHTELSNGLEVVVTPNHTMPIVTVLLAVRAGAFVEDVSMNGFSHLFEHMIFAGSEDIPDPIEFRRQMEALGIYSNATTAVDDVEYFFTAETTVVDQAMGLFAGALRTPAFLDSELEREKRVVLDEFDLNDSNANYVRERRARAELFGSYASRLEPLGERSVVTQATSDQLRAAHSTYYVPNNALLAFSGDVSLEEARTLAQVHFGDWARRENPIARNPPPLPLPLDSSRYVVLEANIFDTLITLVWACAGTREDRKGAIAGTLLSEVTNQRDHSFRQLVGPGLATSAQLVFVPNQFASYVQVDINVPVGGEGAALQTLKGVLDGLGSNDDVSVDRLDTAKESVRTSRFYSSSDPGAVPGDVAAEWSRADFESYESYMDAVGAVEQVDIDRFASSCVRGRPFVVVLQSGPDNLAAQGIDPAYLESLL
jgi:zinc protease